MRFFSKHEARGARQGIESAFRQRQQLILAVAIGKRREHVERQPVFNRLVKRFQDARLVARSAAALQQLFALFAAVASEIGMQQVDHGPQVAALLHVHLEQIAQVVQAGRGLAQQALLFDAGRFGVALRDD